MSLLGTDPPVNCELSNQNIGNNTPPKFDVTTGRLAPKKEEALSTSSTFHSITLDGAASLKGTGRCEDESDNGIASP